MLRLERLEERNMPSIFMPSLADWAMAGPLQFTQQAGSPSTPPTSVPNVTPSDKTAAFITSTPIAVQSTDDGPAAFNAAFGPNLVSYSYNDVPGIDYRHVEVTDCKGLVVFQADVHGTNPFGLALTQAQFTHSGVYQEAIASYSQGLLQFTTVSAVVVHLPQ